MFCVPRIESRISSNFSVALRNLGLTGTSVATDSSGNNSFCFLKKKLFKEFKGFVASSAASSVFGIVLCQKDMKLGTLEVSPFSSTNSVIVKFSPVFLQSLFSCARAAVNRLSRTLKRVLPRLACLGALAPDRLPATFSKASKTACVDSKRPFEISASKTACVKTAAS